MRSALVGDRFLPNGSGGWIDLVTGQRTLVRLRSMSYRRLHRTDQLEEKSTSPPSRWALIDEGRINATLWFEARGRRSVRTFDSLPPRDQAELARVTEIALAPVIGIRHVRLTTSGAAVMTMMSVVAKRMRELGYVAIRAGAKVPAALRRYLAHRHLSLFVRSRRDRTAAIPWIRELARVSPRAHLILQLEPTARSTLEESRTIAAIASLSARASWIDRVASATKEAHLLIGARALDRAEALLAALDVEAAVRGAPVPRDVALAWARLRLCQGRLEESRSRLHASSAPGTVGRSHHAPRVRHSRVAATHSRR